MEAHCTTIACDIDGIIAPLLDEISPTCAELPYVNHGTHVLLHGIAALKKWHHLGAQIQGHSTWRPPYTDELAQAVRLPQFETFASEQEYLRPSPPDSWWKLAAVQRWLHQRPAHTRERLVWINDDIEEAVSSG